jgi:hypothetical protein
MNIFSRTNNKVTANQNTLRTRLDDILAHDELYALAESKSAVKPTQAAVSNGQSNIISITPFLKRDVSNLGGFTA